MIGRGFALRHEGLGIAEAIVSEFQVEDRAGGGYLKRMCLCLSNILVILVSLSRDISSISNM